jgi:hypothetical protein
MGHHSIQNGVTRDQNIDSKNSQIIENFNEQITQIFNAKFDYMAKILISLTRENKSSSKIMHSIKRNNLNKFNRQKYASENLANSLEDGQNSGDHLAGCSNNSNKIDDLSLICQLEPVLDVESEEISTDNTNVKIKWCIKDLKNERFLNETDEFDKNLLSKIGEYLIYAYETDMTQSKLENVDYSSMSYVIFEHYSIRFFSKVHAMHNFRTPQI